MKDKFESWIERWARDRDVSLPDPPGVDIDPLHIELARQANAQASQILPDANTQAILALLDHTQARNYDLQVEVRDLRIKLKDALQRKARITALETEVLELRTLIVLAAHQ